jgi:putative ABC transport system permease protein
MNNKQKTIKLKTKLTMYRNFLKIALRYLWRNKTYSLLNFVCLTFALACSIFAVLYILNIFSFDKFNKNYDRLYSVEAYVTYFNGDQFPKVLLSASLPPMLKQQAPEIEKVTRVADRSFAFSNGDKTITGQGIFADDNFFDVFSFPFVRGNNSKMLNDLNSIVISESMAYKFFETTDCLGKTLLLNDGKKQEAFRIDGVFKRVPKQSTLQFDFVIPFSKYLAGNSWANETGASSNSTWILLNQNSDKNKVEGKIAGLIKNQEPTMNQKLFLFPLKDKALYSYSRGHRVWREMQYVVIVGSIGFAILLIACFNFINLAIALNFKRYREAGIKKVSGSSRGGLILQFIGETFVLTFISLVSAVFLVYLLLPGFNAIFHFDIQLNLLSSKMILFFLSVTSFTALVSGLLPSLYLASSNPLNVLKGKIAVDNSYSVFRQSLIVFQFVIPVILIIGMMVIKAQDRFMRDYDLGVDKNKLVVLNNTENIQRHAQSAKADLLSIPGVSAVSFTNCIPARGFTPTNEVSWEGKDENQKLHFWCINSDFDYNKTVNVNLVDGRFFDRSFSADSMCYLINDVAARVMKYKNPVGSSITVEGTKGTVIGVFRDFHVVDLAGPFVPTIIRLKPVGQPTILLKFASGNFPQLVENIRAVYKNYESDSKLDARLYDDLPSYSNLSLPSKLVGTAFIIALLLACLGLFGLASFTAESRTKEIGIRKTNGATTRSVMKLLLGNYTKWLVIATGIALPFAFLVGRFFLGRFYFHTPMPLWVFFVGPIFAVLVALFTVSLQTWRAANHNPVKALRYE